VRHVCAVLGALLLSGCVAAEPPALQSAPSARARTQAAAQPALTTPSAWEGFVSAVRRWAEEATLALKGDSPTIVTTAAVPSSVPVTHQTTQRGLPDGARPAAARVRLVTVDPAKAESRVSDRPSRQRAAQPFRAARVLTVSNPTLAYEAAMHRRDARAMARAAAQLTQRPVTAASIRALNDSLGILVDDQIVQAVVRAAR
jgi:hypothetical protein